MRALLKELALSFGPSGCEDEVRDIIEKYVRENMPKGAELWRDCNGGLFLHVKNEGKPNLRGLTLCFITVYKYYFLFITMLNARNHT